MNKHTKHFFNHRRLIRITMYNYYLTRIGDAQWKSVTSPSISNCLDNVWSKLREESYQKGKTL